MRQFILLLITVTFLILTLLSGCSKEAITPSYHKNIFRCKVNGIAWSAACPSSGLFGCEPIDCQYYWKDTKTIEFGVERRTGDNSIYQSLHLYKYKSEIGDNELAYTSSTYGDYNQITGCKTYFLDTTRTRRLTILDVDTINYIIKGSFEFTIYNKCLDTLRFHDGEFDVNFRF